MKQSFEPDLFFDERTGDLDLGAIRQALRRKRHWIIWPTLATFLCVGIFVMITKPVYTAEAQVLLENQESFLTRPQRAEIPSENATNLDPESVASQVQLITSRDIARRAIKKLGLIGDPEFDPLAKGIGAISRMLILFGLKRDPTGLPPEDRVVDSFLRHLTVFSPTKTRVLTIEFRSRDPNLAARAANEIVALYLEMQSDAKRTRAKAAAASLATQIVALRSQLTTAADKVEHYRTSFGLLAGSNNMTIAGQQLADLNGELSKARTAEADAQAKAALVRELIREGRISEIADVANNDLVRRIAEQRVAAKAQLASESRTLLPAHPRIQALKAQISDLDAQLRIAVRKTAAALENNARFAAGRVANLETAVNQQKLAVARSNTDEVHLHELERVARALRDQLDSSMGKYQEALAREDSPATPADARMINRAAPPDHPSFPKKIPMLVFGTVAAFILSAAAVIGSELLAGQTTPPSKPPIRRPQVVGDDPPRPSQHSPLLDRLKDFDGPSAEIRPNLAEADLSDEAADVPATDAPPETQDMPSVSGRGARIVTTSVAESDAATEALIAFARSLTQEGRAIIIDLDAKNGQLSSLVRSDTGSAANSGERTAGLTDLLAGSVTFAEAICRDATSRLHFISFGSADDFDPTDLDLVLDALAQTYDFILLAASGVHASGTAKSLASYADFVVLVGAGDVARESCDEAVRELIEAGALEVAIIGGGRKQEVPELNVA